LRRLIGYDGRDGRRREPDAEPGKEYPPVAVSPLFPLGRVVATVGATEALAEAGQLPHEFLARHCIGDWGDLDEHDRTVNDEAVLSFGRILSAYALSNDERIWIITEADRSATTILLPDE
jgi:hypothetical protein